MEKSISPRIIRGSRKPGLVNSVLLRATRCNSVVKVIELMLPGLLGWYTLIKNIIVSRHSFLLLLLCIYADIFSVTLASGIRSISRREGLSNGAVTAIAKDAEGYIWFATWNGLNRYDGSTIVRYTANSLPYALHNHVIRELYPAATGCIWMLTNRGISRYDNIYDRFYSFFTNEAENINYENDISLCHSDVYGTLASVFEKGIFKYDSLSGDFKKIDFAGASASASANVKRVLFIGDTPYCIAGNLLYKIGDNQLLPVLKLPLNGIISSARGIFVHDRPVLLITQRNGNAFIIDTDADKTIELILPDDMITSFSCSADEDRLWAGTEKGRIYTYSFITGKLEPYNAIQNLLPNNVISARIFSIFESDDDLLWIGTDGNGVYNLKLSAYPFNSISSRQLSYPIVRCILVTRNKDILIGTKGGGVDIFDSNGKHKKHLSTKNGLTNNSVLSFLERADGTILVGTDGFGIDVISPDYTSVRNFPDDFLKENSLRFASVYRILEDSDHKIFLGTSGYGVIMLQFNDQSANLANPISFEQLILDQSIVKPAQQKQIVYALTEERPGIIWIGTRGLGVYRYNTITKRVLEQFNTLTHPGRILNDDVLSVFADKNKNIWVGTSGGLYEISPENDFAIMTNPVIQEHFKNISFQTIQHDNGNNLWMATSQGICCIDMPTGNVKNFNTDDGLINYEYSDGASFFDTESNQLYMGGTLGIDIIETSEIKFASYHPPIAINNLSVRNMPVAPNPDGTPEIRINHMKRLDLKYNQNTLTFEVTPLVFRGKERHKISYRLGGFDNDWIVTAAGQSIHFSNLLPGKYNFRVRVSDENSNWSPVLKELEIRIHPPFWLTFWAFAAYILTLTSVIYLIIRSNRRRNARKKEAELQEYRLKKEEELHSYKIEFFTNIAHEFRTPLTLITSYIQSLVEDEKAFPSRFKLLKIHHNSVKLQRLVMEIMQFRKLEKGKEILSVQQINPEQLTMEVLSDFELMARKKDIRYEVECNQPDATINTDPDKFQRIISNLISNAVKYTRNGGAISVRLVLSPAELVLEVKNTGLGISQAYISRIFEPFSNIPPQNGEPFRGFVSTGLGLAVTKGLVELLGGTISCDSMENEWIKFTCNFPLTLEISSTGVIQEETDKYSLADQIQNEAVTETPAPASYELSPDKPVILLVEDNPDIVLLLKELLSPKYILKHAGNGEEAMAILKTTNIDLVVSDIMMPVMDGIELTKKIRADFDTSHLPLILLTAKTEIEDKIQGLEAGADSYIPKPFHSGHLKVRIEKLLQTRKNIRKRFNEFQDQVSGVKDIQDPFFHKMLNYIDTNIDDEGLSTEKLCEYLSISKSSLYNKTKSLLETTPHGLINQRRVRKAAMLLQSTTLTVSEIIDQTGFRSRAHFYELFNKVFGCSPSDYRQKIN